MTAIALPVAQSLLCEYHANPIGIDRAKPRFSWRLAPIAARRGLAQSAYRILVACDEAALAADRGDLWDSGKVASSQSVFVTYAGKALVSSQRAFWKVRVWDETGAASAWSKPAFFEMGLLKPTDWSAQWIGSDLPGASHAVPPATHLRKNFSLPANKSIASARLYATALGVYEFHLNGQRVSEDILTPGWTDYNKRVQYQVYDVASLLQPGDNAAGAILGDGWYTGYTGNLVRRQFYGKSPKFLAQIVIKFTDGSSQTLVTDGSWQFTSAGPIVANDLMQGEHHDGRVDITGWDTTSFDAKSWNGAIVSPDTGIPRVATQGPTVRAIEEVKPISIRKLGHPWQNRHAYIIDLGQNMVGRVRLRIANPIAGVTVRLRFMEMLDGGLTGKPYTANLREAQQTDRYTMHGRGGEENFEPKFTFHGFRFVEVDYYPGELTADDIRGVVLHSDIKPTGTFECSDPLLNQLQHNIQWGQKGNFLDVPTDCPQRDERLGWTGDAQAFCRTAAFNFDVSGFFAKWCQDLMDSQHPDGATPCIAPNVEPSHRPQSPGHDGGPAWSDAMSICPWTMYLVYADRELIAHQYEAVKKHVNFLRDHRSIDFIRSHPDLDAWHGFGDWLATDAGREIVWGLTPKEIVGTAYLSFSAKLASKMAHALGHAEEERFYKELSEKVAQRFVERFVTKDGLIAGNTQTSYVLALHFDLLPEKLRPIAANELVRRIKERGGHISTGFVGSAYVLHALSNAGKLDVAYQLLREKTYPSWLYPVTQGATTIWERWDGWTTDKGFQDPGMNSFNHYAYGSVGDWMYQVVTGIEADPLKPGYEHILLQPRPGGGLTHAAATLDTHYGPVKSAWKLDGNKLTWNITVPPNTHATVRVPTTDAASVTESGKPIDAKAKLAAQEAGAVTLSLGAGEYVFTATH